MEWPHKYRMAVVVAVYDATEKAGRDVMWSLKHVAALTRRVTTFFLFLQTRKSVTEVIHSSVCPQFYLRIDSVPLFQQILSWPSIWEIIKHIRT